MPDNDIDSKIKGNRISNEIEARAVHLVDIHQKKTVQEL